MSTFKPNEQQKQAISQLQGDLVVAAGAGSGKTAVLARRFAHAVSGDDPEGLAVGMDGVLTITFTRKAAAELGERIRRVLMERGSAGIAEARRVDEGWISTIDSFCSRIVKRHVLELGVDPTVRYGDEVQTAQLRRDAAQSVVAAWIAEHGETDVARYGASSLVEALMRDLEKLRAMGRGPTSLMRVRGSVPAQTVSQLVQRCQELMRAIDALGPPSNKTRDGNLETAQAVIELCEGRQELSDSDEAGVLLRRLLPMKFGLAAKPKSEAAAAREGLDRLTAELANVVLAPCAASYRSLLERYEASYAERKHAAGVMDFGDAVEGVARLFAERPEIAARYKRLFGLIMIDEFQDTNELQMSAIGPIRDENLCVVGDVQQSIYGFRYADVGVMRSFEAETETILPLTANYRTHPDILQVVNRAFSQDVLMGADFLPLEAQRSKEYKVRWPPLEPRVEIALLNETACETGTHASHEAAIVAARIHRLIESGAAPEDIVVLMRAMTHAPKIAAALEDRGIVAHLASGEAFFDTPEVADIRALLRAVSVPQDDAAVLAVLAGPLGALDDDALLVVARARPPKGTLWDGLCVVASGETGAEPTIAANASAIHEKLVHLRSLEGGLALSDLIHHATHVFDYDLTLLTSSSSGPQAWSNVNKLMRMAADFENAERCSTGAFLEHLRDYETLIGREPVAPSAAAEGAVRIMSVHAAKGLEFPVVVLPGLGRGLASATKGRMLVERDSQGEPRLALRWPADGSVMESVADSSFDSLKTERKRLDIEEEKRVLYVAMTRAEEALVLVGQADPAKPKETAIGLITQALGLTPGESAVDVGGVSVRVEWHEPTCDQQDEPEEEGPAGAREERVALPSLEDVLDEAEMIICAPEVVTQVPTRLSYTSVHTFDQCPFQFYARHVLSLSHPAAQGGQGLDVGTAVHLALQNPDPAASAVRVAAQLRLDKEQAERVEHAVDAFLGSSCAKRIESSERVYREQPFAVALGPSRLQGQIDLIAHDGPSALILDYKTGQDRDASLARSRLAGYELQASCYALAALEGGAVHVEVVFVFVEQGCYEVSHEFGRGDAETIRRSLMQRIDRMGGGEYPWLDRRDETLCSRCVAEGLCPHSPMTCCLS